MTQDIIQFHELVCNHARRVQRLACNNSPDFIVNRDWYRFTTHSDRLLPRIIVVADNPGELERANSVYLYRGGPAGSTARRFFDAVSGVCALETGWAIVFNKSSFYTPVTNDLTRLMRSSDICPLLFQALREDQRANGRVVASIVAALQIPVLTVGAGEGRVFDCFESGLNAEPMRHTNTESETHLLGRRLRRTYFTAPHFSRSTIFRRQSILCGWTSRFDAFVAGNHCKKTDAGNLRSINFMNAPRETGGVSIKKRRMATKYMFEVLLGG